METYFILLFAIFCILSLGSEVKAENECSSNPCVNGATCVDGNYGYYICQCATSWMGKNCEIAVEGVNCGRNYYNSTGSISSPNYPDDYPNNVHCLYLIRVYGATAFTLDFTSFNFLSYPDSIFVGIGPIPSSASKKDNLFWLRSYMLTYNTNEIWVEFISDYQITNSGWSFTYTAEFNECGCLNDGTCVDYNNPPYCSCDAGWEGEHCEIDINECASMPCFNGGTCSDCNNHYSCTCSSGWYGSRCQYEDLDYCQGNNPCLNGGTCVDSTTRFSCNCEFGYTDDTCSTEVSKCLRNICLNGGTCYVSFDYWFECKCSPGYSGDTCETEIKECSSEPCLNGGTCNDDINLYSCDCLPGWTGDNCEIEIDECASSPCQNGGICHDVFNQYICICVSGWHGDMCNEENSGDNMTAYVATIVLGVMMLLMVVGFIFYKFYHLRNTRNGNDTERPVVQFTVPKETAAISTASAYENQVIINY